VKGTPCLPSRTSRPLTIAPEVANLLGSEQAIVRVFDTAQAGYICTVCAQPGKLAADAPAVVLVLAYSDGPNVVRLAHHGCSDSGIIPMTGQPDINPAIVFPAVGWLRPADGDPAPVLVIGPRAHAYTVTAGGDTTDRLTAGLLAYGFGLLTHPEAPMPQLDAVTAYLSADGTLTLIDAGDDVLWSGVLDLPDGWTEHAPPDRPDRGRVRRRAHPRRPRP